MLLLAAGLSTASQAQVSREEAGDRIEVYAHRMVHQPAKDALSLVEPLLSPRGTVELHTAWNLLVFRDTRTALRRIEPFVRDFDHVRRKLRIEIVILRAGADAGAVSESSPSVGGGEPLPDWLNDGLGKLLGLRSYGSLATAHLTSMEGQKVEYVLGSDYRVRFETGTVVSNRRLRLRSFEIYRGGANRLFFADLSLQIDKPLVIAFARDEAAGVQLVVAVTCRQHQDQTVVPTGSGG